MLGSIPRGSTRALALVLSFVMLTVFVMTTASNANASTNPNAAGAASNMLLVGRLSMADEQSIYVNGNQATNGTTIFSGMRLQSPDGVNAVVRLGSLGQLSFDPNTDLTLEFTNSLVQVKVASGTAMLTTNAGVAGVLTSPDGTVSRSDGATAATLTTAYATMPKPAAKMSNRARALWIILPIAAAVTIIAIVAANDDNDSPSNP